MDGIELSNGLSLKNREAVARRKDPLGTLGYIARIDIKKKKIKNKSNKFKQIFSC